MKYKDFSKKAQQKLQIQTWLRKVHCNKKTEFFFINEYKNELYYISKRQYKRLVYFFVYILLLNIVNII